jgi:simple sugar transport system permease protein
VSEDRTDGVAEASERGVRRALVNAVGALLFPVIAIVMAFVIGALIVLATGNNPVAAYSALLQGAVGGPTAIGRTLLNATPLIFTGLAVAVAFRAGLFNIGGEGQLFIGAITAAGLGAALGGLGVLAIAPVLAASLLGGFLWGAIPGVLKARFGAHEVITTIMLNFIAINLATYLALNTFSGGGIVPGTATIEPDARLPAIGLGLGRTNYGLFVALAAAWRCWASTATCPSRSSPTSASTGSGSPCSGATTRRASCWERCSSAGSPPAPRRCSSPPRSRWTWPTCSSP